VNTQWRPGRSATARRGRMIACLVIGCLFMLAGILLAVVPLDHGTIPQWNGLCSSGVGQLGQLFSPSAQADCGLVGDADHAIGWLAGLGAAGLLTGIILAATGAGVRPLPSCLHCSQPAAAHLQGWCPPCGRCGQFFAAHTAGLCPTAPSAPRY
jgi:hypothetical protein